MPYESSPLAFASAAAIVGTVVCVIGLGVGFLLPEPRGGIED